MGLWSFLSGRGWTPDIERMTVDEWADQWFKYQGLGYPLIGRHQSNIHSDYECPPNDFVGYINGMYKTDGIVFACMMTRQLVFSEARFMFQHMEKGRPGDLFGKPELELLEKPWPNGTTGELLARAIQDVDLCGNHYVVREPGRLRRLRPDWVDIVLTAPPDEAVESDVWGYVYKPGGTEDSSLWTTYVPGEIAHWSPIPDPDAQYRGMSWLTPIVREIMADKAATKHKAKFFENAATPNLAVAFKETVTQEQFKEFMEQMNSLKGGVEHAYETLYLGGGADVTVVGKDLKQMDFKATQGAGETRIAAAARVSPVIVGLSEGMQGSSLNSGNFTAAKRLFGDATMRPLWRSVAAAYAPIISVPKDARLWYDDRDIAFLRADRTETVEIQSTEASTIAKLVQDGYTHESVVEAVLQEDWRLLEHSGLFSVQLQPPFDTNFDGNPDNVDTDGDGKPDSGGGTGKPKAQKQNIVAPPNPQNKFKQQVPSNVKIPKPPGGGF